MTLIERINNYLQNGGLFNPEVMEHDKVRELLIDCQIELVTALADVKITATREECFLWLQGIKGNLPLEHRVSVVLAEREREVRLQEAEWWFDNWDGENIPGCMERLAKLRAPAKGGK